MNEKELLNEKLINNVSGKVYKFTSSMSKKERCDKFKQMIKGYEIIEYEGVKFKIYKKGIAPIKPRGFDDLE